MTLKTRRASRRPAALLLGAMMAVLIGVGVGVGAAQAQDQPPPAQGAADAIPRPPAARPQPAPVPDPDQETDPAKKLMLEMARATRDLSSLSYHSKFYSTGALEQIAPRGEAQVVMLRADTGERPWLQHATGTGAAKASDSDIDFDVVWLEGTVEWLDHGQKKLIIRPARQAKGAAFQVADAGRLKDLVDAAPFSKEVQAESFVIESPAEVNGVPCQTVYVTQKGGRGRSRWWIADADHLPRKVSRIFDAPTGGGGATETTEIVLEISNMEVNPPLSQDAIAITPPAGYGRDEIGPGKGLTPPNLNRSGKANDATNSAAPAAPAEPPPPPAKPKALPFELTSTTGEKVSLAAQAGNVVVLQFWGTWHLPSKTACGELNALTERLKGRKVKVFALTVREKTDEGPREFTRPFSFVTLLNADKIADGYGISIFPTYVIVGPEGELLDTIAGYKKDETMKKVAEAVDRALGVPAGPLADGQPAGPAEVH